MPSGCWRSARWPATAPSTWPAASAPTAASSRSNSSHGTPRWRAKNFERAGVADRVEVIVGAALDTLPRLAERGETFDMFFIDADKENNVAYVEWAIELGQAGFSHRGGQHRPRWVGC